MNTTKPNPARHLLRVVPIGGEPTRFWVEGSALVCRSCGHLVPRERFAAGDACPKCLGRRRPQPGALEVRWHLVDITAMHKNGLCDCEFFTMTLKPKIQKSDAKYLSQGFLRCAHIQLAREVALNLTLAAYQRGREKEDNGE